MLLHWAIFGECERGSELRRLGGERRFPRLRAKNMAQASTNTSCSSAGPLVRSSGKWKLQGNVLGRGDRAPRDRFLGTMLVQERRAKREPSSPAHAERAMVRTLGMRKPLGKVNLIYLRDVTLGLPGHEMCFTSPLAYKSLVYTLPSFSNPESR